MSERKSLTIEVNINQPWVLAAPPSLAHWLCLKDPNEVWRADVRPDGCVEIREDYNADPNDSDMLHICNLDDFIVRLVALRDEAKKHFGEDWGK